MPISDVTNLNNFWSDLIVEELIRLGVNYFCIAPGSRSAPLAIAVAENPSAHSFVHFDERGLGFHALGYTSATLQPVCLITTSGTAVANLLPAVIEASKKKLPLIILTADRPPELRWTGANQVIDQVKIFGDYVRWFCDLPCPTSEIAPEYVLTTMDLAVFKSRNSNTAGPVHVNCMFREPLISSDGQVKYSMESQVIDKWKKSDKPYTTYYPTRNNNLSQSFEDIVGIITASKSGIIVAGKLASKSDQMAVMRLAERIKWPIFPDISSGLRFGQEKKEIINYYDTVLGMTEWQAQLQPDCILHLGGRMTSRRYYDFINESKPNHYITVLNHSLRNDPLHKVTYRIQSSVDSFCRAISKKLPSLQSGDTFKQLVKTNLFIDKMMDDLLGSQDLCEAQVVRLITKHIPKSHGLFLSASLPVREADIYAQYNGTSVVIGANRGASGIDGTVASATGFALGLKGPVTLIIGDLAFMHDQNSLAMLKSITTPLIIVLLNNQGGGVFSFLPVAKYQKEKFEYYFGATHTLSFQATAQQFALDYYLPSNVEEFIQVYRRALKSSNSTIIEVSTNRDTNVLIHQKLQKLLNSKTKQGNKDYESNEI